MRYGGKGQRRNSPVPTALTIHPRTYIRRQTTIRDNVVRAMPTAAIVGPEVVASGLSVLKVQPIAKADRESNKTSTTRESWTWRRGGRAGAWAWYGFYNGVRRDRVKAMAIADQKRLNLGRAGDLQEWKMSTTTSGRIPVGLASVHCRSWQVCRSSRDAVWDPRSRFRSMDSGY